MNDYGFSNDRSLNISERGTFQLSDDSTKLKRILLTYPSNTW